MNYFHPAIAITTLSISSFRNVSFHVDLTHFQIMILRLSSRQFEAKSFAGSNFGQK